MENRDLKDKSTDKIEGISKTNFDLDNRINSLSSKYFENSFKNLSQPRMLGSIHMRRDGSSNGLPYINNVLKEELQMKLAKSLKSTIFNPITKFLIIMAIAFNFIWLLYNFM